MCYSVINPCGFWTLGTLSAFASNGNTLYNVMGVKRHVMPVDFPEGESISGAEINLTVCAVSNGVLCCNLAKSKSVLKMCMVADNCHLSKRHKFVNFRLNFNYFELKINERKTSNYFVFH